MREKRDESREKVVVILRQKERRVEKMVTEDLLAVRGREKRDKRRGMRERKKAIGERGRRRDGKEEAKR